MKTQHCIVCCLVAGFIFLSPRTGQAQTPRAGRSPKDSKGKILWRGKVHVDVNSRHEWTRPHYGINGRWYGRDAWQEINRRSVQSMVLEESLRSRSMRKPGGYFVASLAIVDGSFREVCRLHHSDFLVKPPSLTFRAKRDSPPMSAGDIFYFPRDDRSGTRGKSKRPAQYWFGGISWRGFNSMPNFSVTVIRDGFGRPVQNGKSHDAPYSGFSPRTLGSWVVGGNLGLSPKKRQGRRKSAGIYADRQARYMETKKKVLRGQYSNSVRQVGPGLGWPALQLLLGQGFTGSRLPTWRPSDPKNGPPPKGAAPLADHKRPSTLVSKVTVRWYFKRDPMPVELELTACPEDWVPDIRGSKSQVRFKARIVKPKNLAAKWKFVLFKQSRLRGVCNNAFMPKSLRKQWNKGGQRYEDGRRHKGKNDPDLLFDFRRYDGSDGVFKSVTKRPWQVLKTEQELNEVEFVVNSLDYGAYGKLTAAAYIDGRWRWLKAGEVKETKEKFARIPRDNSAPADGPYIAPAAVSDVTGVSYAGRKPKDDDSRPRGRVCCKGDGLSVFEEYRGFVARGFSEEKKAKPIFQRLDPTWKDLFIRINQADRRLLAPYVFDFLMASELAVHTVTPQREGQPFIRPNRVINFLSDKKHGIEPQHALYLRNGWIPGGKPGFSTGIGPPRYVNGTYINGIKVYEIWSKLTSKLGGDTTSTVSGSEIDKFLSRVIVHELGHSVGIRHHGDGDIKVMKLGGKTYKKVGVEGGQCSGNTDCAMRYLFSRYYLHKKAGSIPQRFDNSQFTFGNQLCSDNLGTGFNDASTPGYYFGDATRGNCKGQIVVNDRCPQSSGSSGSVEAGGDFDADDADDDIPAEDPEVARSQEEAGVVLELSVDGPHRGEIVPGEAVLIKFSLRGRDAGDVPWGAEPAEVGPAKATPFGSNDSPWTKQVEFVTRDENGKWVPAPVKVQPVGSVQRLTMRPRTPKSPAGIRLVDVADPVISPTPDATYLATFAIVSTATEALPKGKLRIYASLPVTGEAGKKQGGRRVLSGSIVLDVIDPEKLPPREKQVVVFRRKLSKARLAMASNRYQQSEELARAVITEEPDSVEARLLLADSLLMQKKLKEAYEEYERALDHFNPDEVKPGGQGIQEPPELLLFTLYILKKRLAANP